GWTPSNTSLGCPSGQGSDIDCSPKRNGSTQPAEEHQQRFPPARQSPVMMQTLTPDIRTAMDRKVNTANMRCPSEHSSPTPLAYTICTVMFGNGFRTAGTRITRGYSKRAQDRRPNATSARECCVGGLGSIRQGTFVQPTATETCRSTGIRPSDSGWRVRSIDPEVCVCVPLVRSCATLSRSRVQGRPREGKRHECPAQPLVGSMQRQPRVHWMGLSADRLDRHHS